MRSAGGTAALLATALLACDAGAATIEPSVKTDDIAVNGNCTLREAVQAANTNAAVDACRKGQAAKADVIELRNGDYDLTVAGEEDLNAGGDLDLLGGGPVEIRGRGINRTRVFGLPAERALDLLTSDRLKVFALTLDGGSGEQRGGVIQADDSAGDPRLILDRVKVRDGTAQFGGGIGMIDGRLRVKRSIITDNEARVSTTGFPGVHAVGGGINLLFDVDARISDTVLLNNDAVTNDSSAFGGGIATVFSTGGGETQVRRSLFNGNDVYSSSANASTTRQGGAIHTNQQTGQLLVVNSTFYLNRSLGTGSGSVGGAVFAQQGETTIDHASFSENEAVAGSALGLAGGSVALSRSALVTESGPLCSEGSGSFSSGGYNVVGVNPFGCSLGGPRDLNADPLLAGGLADTGGQTETLRLAAASPAVDRIPASGCGPAEGEDQRDFKRPAGARCDSGAWERGAKP
jgi:CSLREA domain-containing protein